MKAADPSRWQIRRIRAADVMLAAYAFGSDDEAAETVVLLHGLGHWTDGAWGTLVPWLDPARRYVAFDLPGFGASEKPATRYDRAFFRRALDDAIAALAPARFALIGHSLGGFIAADWAGAHPERLTHLALIAPAGFARTPHHVVSALAARTLGGLLARAAPSRRLVARLLQRAVTPRFALDPAHVERMYALSQERAFRRAFGSVYAAALETFFNRAALHRGFARYRGPVFCAWGRRDRYISASGIGDVARVYPQATTLILENSGHIPMIEQPKELATALERFLKT